MFFNLEAWHVVSGIQVGGEDVAFYGVDVRRAGSVLDGQVKKVKLVIQANGAYTLGAPGTAKVKIVDQ